MPLHSDESVHPEAASGLAAHNVRRQSLAACP